MNTKSTYIREYYQRKYAISQCYIPMLKISKCSTFSLWVSKVKKFIRKVSHFHNSKSCMIVNIIGSVKSFTFRSGKRLHFIFIFLLKNYMITAQETAEGMRTAQMVL